MPQSLNSLVRPRGLITSAILPPCWQEPHKSLGDSFAKPESLIASGDGLLDAANDNTALGNDRNEQILAALTFSNNDILEDVLNNLHEIDDRFTTFLEEKLDKCRDFEEKEALSSLYDVVKYVLDKVASVQDEAHVNNMDEELSIDAVKQRMQEVQNPGFSEGGPSGGTSRASSSEFMVTKDADSTFPFYSVAFRRNLRGGAADGGSFEKFRIMRHELP